MTILSDKYCIPYISRCNSFRQPDNYTEIPDSKAEEYLSERIPFFDCPDEEFVLTWYFRFWVLRKHIRKTEKGSHVLTEFLPPVSWGRKYNTILMAAPQHINEARWLRNDSLAEEYLRFWYSGEGTLHEFTSYLPHSALEIAKTYGKTSFLSDVYPAMQKEAEIWDAGFIKDYGEWDPNRYWGKFHIGLCENGLYSTVDDLEGSEYSVDWKGFRPFINSAMKGSYTALSEIALILGKESDSKEYSVRAKNLASLIKEKLWNEERGFFTTLGNDGVQGRARDLYGYTPWLFGIPDACHETAWNALLDSNVFLAPAAIPFLDQSDPGFALNYTGHSCQWNGPSWPLATGLTIKALAELLHSEGEHPLSKKDYFFFLRQYASNQRITLPDGRRIPWIDENQHPYTGEWIAKTKRGGFSSDVGTDYNHSAFADLVITGLFGICPSLDDILMIDPLLPDGVWDHFCLDGVPYHSHELCLMFDKTGLKYNKGKGFAVFVDGKEKIRTENISTLKIELK